MNLIVASESDMNVYENVERARQFLEGKFRRFSESRMKNVHITIRYVPIIMPDDLKDRYKARSRILKAKKVIDCAPQLDYATFLSGGFTEQIAEYAEGLRWASHQLHEFSVPDEEVDQFDAFLTKLHRLP